MISWPKQTNLENSSYNKFLSDFKLSKWKANYVQVLHSHTIGQGYRVSKDVEFDKTPYQEIIVWICFTENLF